MQFTTRLHCQVVGSKSDIASITLVSLLLSVRALRRMSFCAPVLLAVGRFGGVR